LCRFFSCATLHKSLCQVKKMKKSRGLWHTIVVLNCDGKDLIGKVIHFSLFVADILLSSPKKGEGLWVRVINHLGSSRLCVIIFAYGIVKYLSDKTFRTILQIFYQYRPRFHTETRRAPSLPLL
jgi:hypothetical protein